MRQRAVLDERTPPTTFRANAANKQRGSNDETRAHCFVSSRLQLSSHVASNLRLKSVHPLHPPGEASRQPAHSMGRHARLALGFRNRVNRFRITPQPTGIRTTNTQAAANSDEKRHEDGRGYSPTIGSFLLFLYLGCFVSSFSAILASLGA